MSPERTLSSPQDRSWIKEGACNGLDPEIFFPTDKVGIAQAKAICATCVVKVPCQEYSLANNQNHGVWGGEPKGGQGHRQPGRPRGSKNL